MWGRDRDLGKQGVRDSPWVCPYCPSGTLHDCVLVGDIEVQHALPMHAKPQKFLMQLPQVSH